MNEPNADDLPELRSASLSEAQVHALFEDLRACANVLAIQLKGPGRETAVAAPSLDDAKSMLTSGRVHGVQIRYAYQGREYADTLLRAGDGFRLVRM